MRCPPRFLWASVLIFGLMGCGGDDTTTGDSGVTDTDTYCTSNHARVGHAAELSTLFHDTTGTATILDDCTIKVTGFSYDGTGLDVRFYGALGSDFENGFAMTEDLRKNGGYDNETLTIDMPDGHSFDEVDSLSLWCVDVGISFGEGVFAEP